MIGDPRERPVPAGISTPRTSTETSSLAALRSHTTAQPRDAGSRTRALDTRRRSAQRDPPDRNRGRLSRTGRRRPRLWPGGIRRRWRRRARRDGQAGVGPGLGIRSQTTLVTRRTDRARRSSVIRPGSIAVPQHPAAAPLALRRHGMDGAFEAVEGRGAVTTRDRERLVVLISAGLTPGHRLLNPFLRKGGTGRAEAEAVSRTLSACAQADLGRVRPCCGSGARGSAPRHTRPGSIGCFVAGVVRDGVRPLGRGVGR